ncbi:MAG: type IX secretion system protein PorQ [Tannerellaceae bacterium]|jgi:hypothetical protein|nr:type IX secretion system protein PorQ [Tannerellaceae bacterium]
MHKLLYGVIAVMILWTAIPPSSAQERGEVFAFLRYPTSARVNALGGEAVSLTDSDASTTLHNPGLLGGEMSGMLHLSYLSYLADIHLGSILYTRAQGDRGAWAIAVSYLNYGSITESLPDGSLTGAQVSAQDLAFEAAYGYDLSYRWRGGLALKFIYSSFAGYTATGLAADVGLSYYNDGNNLSFGLAAKNLGAQLSAYEGNIRKSLPFDLQMGFSYRLAHAPIRLTLTAVSLHRWRFEQPSSSATQDNGSRTFFKHLVMGVDLIPTENFYLAVGFNPRRRFDLEVQNANLFGGFSAGTGIRIRRFGLSLSVANYHPSAMSLMFSLSTKL